MATPSVIGALRVVIGADSASLDKGLRESQDSLASFGAAAVKTGAVIAAAMTAAYGAVSLSIVNTLKHMDDINKQSQKIGVPVEQLSALTLAAELSDVSMETLTKSMGKLSKAMVESVTKPSSDAANAFRALGISSQFVTDNMNSPLEVLTKIAGRFDTLDDGAAKGAVTLKLFGKAGQDMIPFLNTGAVGISEMIVLAQRLGVAFSTQAAQAAEKFRDTLTLLSAAKQGIITQLTTYMLPALQTFADRMFEAASNSDKQKSKLDFLKTAFDVLARAVLLVADNFKFLLQLAAIFIGAQIASAAIQMAVAFGRLALAIYTTGVAMSIFNAIRRLSLTGILLIVGGVALLTGNFDAMTAKLKEMGGAIAEALPEGTGEGLSKLLKQLGLDVSALNTDLGTLGTGLTKPKKPTEDLALSLLAGTKAVDSFLESTRKSMAGQEAELATVGLAAGAKEALTVKLKALEIATSANIPVGEELRKKIHETATAAGDLAAKIAGVHLVQQNLSPLQAYTQELNNSTAAMIAASASQEELARNAEKVAEKFGMSASAIGSNVASTMGQLQNLTGTFAKENKAMGIASKAFGIGQAIINTQIAVTKALATLPPPASYAAVALAVATGAASIAQISMQKFASGADFRIPGGIGGADNVPVSFMAQPGERVKVEPNRYGESSGGGGARTPVTINVPSPSLDMIRSLMNQMQGVIKDGYVFTVRPV